MNKKVYVFIDAANLWEAQKSKQKLLDLSKLKTYLKENFSNDIRIFYYDAYPENGTRPYSPEKKFKFYKYLEKGLGFTIRKKPLKQIHNYDGGVHSVIEKGNMDVEISIDIVNFIDDYTELILFSGDSDFLALANFAKARGKKVYVFSAKNNISRELISGSNKYYDILKINDDIWRGDLTIRKQDK